LVIKAKDSLPLFYTFIILKIKKVSVRTLLILMILLISLKGYSSDSTRNTHKRNIAFVSFGGKENFGSVNYEHIFSPGNKINWSYSIGVQPFQPSEKFSVPVSINAFTKGQLHHLELALTATFFMDKFHPYNGGWQNDFNKKLYLTPFVCYRLQGSRSLVLRTGIGPQLLLDPPSDNVVAFRTKVLSPSVFGSIGISF